MGKACRSRVRSGKVSGAPPTVAKKGVNKNSRGPRMMSAKYPAQAPLANANCASSWEEVKLALLSRIEKIQDLARSCHTCGTVEGCGAAIAQIRSIAEELKELIIYRFPAEEVILQPAV